MLLELFILLLAISLAFMFASSSFHDSWKDSIVYPLIDTFLWFIASLTCFDLQIYNGSAFIDIPPLVGFFPINYVFEALAIAMALYTLDRLLQMVRGSPKAKGM